MAEFETRVTRFLEEEGVAYRLLPHDEPVFTVATAAAQRGVNADEMVKSILLRDKDHRFVMACVTGPSRLNPKAVRTFLDGNYKRLTFASAEEIEAVTGYVQGAVNPLCLPEDVPVVFDRAIADCNQVNISSGDPLAGLELYTHDLIRLARAQLADISK